MTRVGITASPAVLRAMMYTNAGDIPVVIIDISEGGVKAHAMEPPALDSAIQIRRNGEVCHGFVGWIGGSKFGVTFESALSSENVEAFIGSGLF
jgi:hypothetical protein